jgi:hypothetical protein
MEQVGNEVLMPKWSSQSPQTPPSALTTDKSNAKGQTFLLSATQPSAFFFDTVQSVDSIDEHFAQGRFGHFGEALPEQHQPLDSPLEGDLENNARTSRADRATWWPLPRTSLLEDDGEKTDAVYKSHMPLGS